jgi:hypothetical protein
MVSIVIELGAIETTAAAGSSFFMQSAMRQFSSDGRAATAAARSATALAQPVVWLGAHTGAT